MDSIDNKNNTGYGENTDHMDNIDHVNNKYNIYKQNRPYWHHIIYSQKIGNINMIFTRMYRYCVHVSSVRLD